MPQGDPLANLLFEMGPSLPGEFGAATIPFIPRALARQMARGIAPAPAPAPAPTPAPPAAEEKPPAEAAAAPAGRAIRLKPKERRGVM